MSAIIPEHLQTLDVNALAPDVELLRSTQLAGDYFHRWLPWRLIGDTLLVATAVPPSPELDAEISALTGRTSIEYRLATPEQLAAAAEQWLADHLQEVAAEKFARDVRAYSAKSGLLGWQKALPACLFALLLFGMLWSWRWTIIIIYAVANLAVFINTTYRMLGVMLRVTNRHRDRRLNRAEQRELSQLPTHSEQLLARCDRDLPVYTILVPVFHEANVVEQVMRNIERLDYPTDKLDVLVLLEADDTETIAAARAARPPAQVRLLVVPPGVPRTKPRACNYGLLFARGEYVVIFDAEDRPDPEQLLKAVQSFRFDQVIDRRRAVSQPLACVQASLNYDNAGYNVLTRMFAIEYAHWFDMMLPGMAGVRAPIPLGGTSNHFRRSALIEVGGWDPYNVTEDADLGIRLSASGYRVGVIRSTTWEEATEQWVPWIRQRTRWIKGYMVTAAVNLRRPWRWLTGNNRRTWLTMFALILGTPVSFLLYPIALGFTLAAWLLAPVLHLGIPHWLIISGMINMIALNVLMIISAGIAAWQRFGWRIALYSIFLPIYWLMHSVAAWRAAVQVIRAPFLWEKTPHGLSEGEDDDDLDPEFSAELVGQLAPLG